MSMKPIDLKAAMSQTYEINRASGSDSARAGMQHQYFSRKMEDAAQRSERATRQADASGQASADGGDGSYYGGQGGRKSKKNPKETAASAYKSSGIVDIRV